MASNNSSIQNISTTTVLPTASSSQSNVHQLPPISTITVLSVPTSHQLTNNSLSGTFISNTLKTNLVNNGSISQHNTNNLAQLITNSTNLSSTQNIQIINGTQLTSITPLAQLNSIPTPNNILNNLNSHNNNGNSNNTNVTLDASNIFTVKENPTILVGVSSNNNLNNTSNENISKTQQISKVSTQVSQSSNTSTLTQSSNLTGIELPAGSDSSITVLPPAKRPRRSSVSSSISNSGSTYSTSSKHEAKSTISVSENNES